MIKKKGEIIDKKECGVDKSVFMINITRCGERKNDFYILLGKYNKNIL